MLHCIYFDSFDSKFDNRDVFFNDRDHDHINSSHYDMSSCHDSMIHVMHQDIVSRLSNFSTYCSYQLFAHKHSKHNHRSYVCASGSEIDHDLALRIVCEEV